MPEPLVRAVSRRAEAEGTTSAEIVRRAIRDYLGGSAAVQPPSGPAPSVGTARGPHDVRYERTCADRYFAYLPKGANPKTNSEYRGRVRCVGTIERHGGSWFWFLRDDSEAGLSETLSEAMEELEARI